MNTAIDAAPAAVRFCPGCGTSTRPGTLFCADCGTRLGPVADLAAPAPATATRPGLLVSALALIAVLAGLLAAAATWLPWFYSFGRHWSGWGLFDFQNVSGDNPLVIDHMFSHHDFDLFATGMTAFGCTLVMALSALAALVLLQAISPERLVRWRHFLHGLSVLSALAWALLLVGTLVPVVVVLREGYALGRFSGAGVEYGLILLWIAAGVSCLALSVAVQPIVRPKKGKAT